jgi:hypothetical protein
MTFLSVNLRIVGVTTLGLGLLHIALPYGLRWSREFAGASPLNREVSYVHCYFIGLACLLWGLLPRAAGRALLEPNPVTRVVLVGAVIFWTSRFVIQLFVFNRHARESLVWRTISVAGTGLWLYLAVVWSCALAAQV